MVRDIESGRLVGTSRLQTGKTAQRNLGYYGITSSSISSSPIPSAPKSSNSAAPASTKTSAT